MIYTYLTSLGIKDIKLGTIYLRFVYENIGFKYFE